VQKGVLLWYFQQNDLVANLYVYMFTKSYTLIPYQLQDHNVQSWENIIFSLCPWDMVEFCSQKTRL
jgi:hypothetical protein